MNKNIYIFLSIALALLITNATYQYMYAYPFELQLAPYRYRVLFTNLWHLVEGVMGTYVGTWFLWFICFSLLAFLIDEIGEQIVPNPRNARLFLLATLVITPTLILLQPGGAFWSIIEAIFIAIALLLILNGRIAWLYPLVFVATLHRETAVLIPLMVFFILRDRKHAAGLLAVWATTYGALRLIIGPVPVHLTLAFILDINLGAGMLRFVVGIPVIAWLFWYAAKGWQVAPEPLRRAAYIIPVYLVLMAVFALWHEWRLVIALYPLLIPLAGVFEVNL